eukprot:TRINITY_DN2841_c0_g1_i1.p1 TRINITY_DN2841_c0_g1~~TRINITY_DN2841_c0_g1_i1.p1  ORF type:complete len:472 (+),score=119.88 TRINITY_DN2841_c0_g1_i1:33-1448(+)
MTIDLNSEENLVYTNIIQHLDAFSEAVISKDQKSSARISRTIFGYRRQLTDGILKSLYCQYISEVNDINCSLEELMLNGTICYQELNHYLLPVLQLILLYLYDNYIELKVDENMMMLLFEKMLKIFSSYQSLCFYHYICSRYYYYFSLFLEKIDEFSKEYVQLFQRQLTLARRSYDSLSVMTLINIILRQSVLKLDFCNSLKFIELSNIEKYIGNDLNQDCRFHYYHGIILAYSLQYSSSLTALLNCLRRTPQQAAALRSSVARFIVVIRLLLGESSERGFFRSEYGDLSVYLELTRAVRKGNMEKFKEIVDEHKDEFVTDRTVLLIEKLPVAVRRMAMTRIAKAYSTISLQQLCDMLELKDVCNTLMVVSKTIRDGVIEGTIDVNDQILKIVDEQSLSENQILQIIKTRIDQVSKLRFDCIEAMRYKSFDLEKMFKEAEKDDEQRRLDEEARAVAEENAQSMEPSRNTGF